MTHVNLTDKDRLMCLYGNREDVQMTGISMDEFEAGCDVMDKKLTVVVPIVVGIAILVVVILWTVRYHRWYIKYHAILCWKREAGATTRERENCFEAMVLYFIYSANPSDQQDGVARISRWVCTRLLPRAEDEWGLCLYVGERDDVGGASKMHNFVFESSDKVVVRLTREFIDDSDCMNYLATALDSSKPLSKYILSYSIVSNLLPFRVVCGNSCFLTLRLSRSRGTARKTGIAVHMMRSGGTCAMH